MWAIIWYIWYFAMWVTFVLIFSFWVLAGKFSVIMDIQLALHAAKNFNSSVLLALCLLAITAVVPLRKFLNHWKYHAPIWVMGAKKAFVTVRNTNMIRVAPMLHVHAPCQLATTRAHLSICTYIVGVNIYVTWHLSNLIPASLFSLWLITNSVFFKKRKKVFYSFWLIDRSVLEMWSLLVVWGLLHQSKDTFMNSQQKRREAMSDSNLPLEISKPELITHHHWGSF